MARPTAMDRVAMGPSCKDLPLAANLGSFSYSRVFALPLLAAQNLSPDVLTRVLLLQHLVLAKKI